MAGGKVLIGGTAYDITKGKTLIGGTAYDITAGKTLVSGTAEDVVFARPYVYTLYDVLYDMTLVPTAGRTAYYNYSINSSTKGSVQVYKPNLSLFYVIGIYNGYLIIAKIKDGAGSLIQQTTTSISLSSSTSQFRLSTTSTTATFYGASLLCVTFPNIDEAVVDSILSNMTVTRLAGRNSSSTGYVRTTDMTHDFYLMTRYGDPGTTYQGQDYDKLGMTILMSYDDTWYGINKVGEYYGCTVSSGYLTCGAGTYGASCIALDG